MHWWRRAYKRCKGGYGAARGGMHPFELFSGQSRYSKSIEWSLCSIVAARGFGLIGESRSIVSDEMKSLLQSFPRFVKKEWLRLRHSDIWATEN